MKRLPEPFATLPAGSGVSLKSRFLLYWARGSARVIARSLFRAPAKAGAHHRCGRYEPNHRQMARGRMMGPCLRRGTRQRKAIRLSRGYARFLAGAFFTGAFRSEEHTSELQSLMRNSYAVFCLKKKTICKTIHADK